MGWLGRIVRRQVGLDGLEREAAEVAARVNILARGEEERRRRRDAGPIVPVARWRWSAGRWERWSFLEGAFVVDDPPQGLLDHVASTGDPVEGAELELADGTWRPRADPADTAEDEDRSDPGPADTGPTPLPSSEPSDPGARPVEEGEPSAGERATDDVASQLQAWRRRSR